MIPFQHGVFATASAAAGGFESIATVTATGGETSLTFSSIPQGYASLQIRAFTKGGTASDVRIRFNSDSAGNYTNHQLYGDGTSVTATGYTGQSGSLIHGVLSGTANMGAFVVDIHSYSTTSQNKTIRTFCGQDANGSGSVTVSSSLWLNTAAVSTIGFVPVGTTFASGDTFALYGIKAAA